MLLTNKHNGTFTFLKYKEANVWILQGVIIV